MGSIPGWGTKIPLAAWHGQKKRKKKRKVDEAIPQLRIFQRLPLPYGIKFKLCAISPLCDFAHAVPTARDASSHCLPDNSSPSFGTRFRHQLLLTPFLTPGPSTELTTASFVPVVPLPTIL